MIYWIFIFCVVLKDDKRHTYCYFRTKYWITNLATMYVATMGRLTELWFKAREAEARKNLHIKLDFINLIIKSMCILFININ